MEDLGASSAAFAKGLAQVGDGQALERKRLRLLGSINVKPSIIPGSPGQVGDRKEIRRKRLRIVVQLM